MSSGEHKMATGEGKLPVLLQTAAVMQFIVYLRKFLQHPQYLNCTYTTALRERRCVLVEFRKSVDSSIVNDSIPLLGAICSTGW